MTQAAQTPTPTNTLTPTPDINLELTTPTGLFISQISGTNSLRFRWNRVINIDRYRVWIAKGSPDSALETQDIVEDNYFDFTVGNTAQTIYFRVASLKEGKVSRPSAWIGGRINIARPTLGFPSKHGANQAKLSWLGVPGATQYEISRSEEGNPLSEHYFQTGGSEAEMIISLPNPSKKYFFKVRAIVENMGGDWSNVVTYPFGPSQLPVPVMNPV